jgi:hypothetical protein
VLKALVEDVDEPERDEDQQRGAEQQRRLLAVQARDLAQDAAESELLLGGGALAPSVGSRGS